MDIFKIFRKKKEIEDVSNPNEVYFHEDSFNQVEFIPRENFDFINAETEKIKTFSNEHNDGNGFTDIYMRKENPISIKQKHILLSKLEETILAIDFDKKTEVYEGYSSARWKCENTFAYTFDRAEIFVSFENDFVKDFWINGFRFHKNEETKKKLEQVLFKIGNDFDLFLTDWDLDTSIDLKNTLEIEKYLNEDLGV